MTANLIGKYHIAKSNLTKDSTTLVISQRKKVEASKPKNYLLLKISDNQFKYVSSMYPIESVLNGYEIDYLKQKYKLTIDQDRQTATIEMLHNSITATFTHKL